MKEIPGFLHNPKATKALIQTTLLVRRLDLSNFSLLEPDAQSQSSISVSQISFRIFLDCKIIIIIII